MTQANFDSAALRYLALRQCLSLTRDQTGRWEAVLPNGVSVFGITLEELTGEMLRRGFPAHDRHYSL